MAFAVVATWLGLALLFVLAVLWLLARDGGWIVADEPHPSTWTESQLASWSIR